MNTVFVRHKKERDYTVVDNVYLQDVNLSWKARGLFTYLLSLPEDWQIHLEEIEKHAPDGRDSLRAAVRELKDRGYMVLSQKKDAKGKFSHNEIEIIERPDSPQTGFPSTGFPSPDNPKLLSTNKQSTNNTKLMSDDGKGKDADVEEIYKFYIKCFGKNENSYKLSPSRRGKIKARLKPKDAGKAMLLTAIEKTSKSPFHRGQNDRKWKADLDWIVKSYEQVEKLFNLEMASNTFLKTAPKKPSAPPPIAVQRERVISPEEAEKNRIILELVRMKKASFSGMRELKTKSIDELRKMKNENNNNSGSDPQPKKQQTNSP